MSRNKSLTIFSVFLLIGGLFATLLLDDVWGSRVSELITIGTAIIGAVALFFQFKRDKEINQANFILEFWKSFSGNEKLQKIKIFCIINVFKIIFKIKMINIKVFIACVKFRRWYEFFCKFVTFFANTFRYYCLNDDILPF